MSDLDHEDDERRILDLANQPVVAHPVAPETREGLTLQRLALAARIGARSDPLVHEIDERIAGLEEKLQQLKVRQARAEARKRALLSRRVRKDDTRRKILAGAIVLGKVASGELDGKRFREWLDQALTRAEDRALFELPPVAGK